MELTGTEADVIQLLRRRRVTDMKTLRNELGISHMTVVRALRKCGYWSSINRNARYYALDDVPRFGEDGLWFYRDVCFSRFRTLDRTLVALVEQAPAGLTVAELEGRLHTRVGNLLSRLRGSNRLSLCRMGREAVYLSTEDERQRQQRETRHSRSGQRGTSSPPDKTSTYPTGCDVVLVLEVLIAFIKTPKADVAAIAKAVRSRGSKITAPAVQRILDFYSLKKKRNTGRRGLGNRPDASTNR
jgi:hypothetical protein